jgi:hypothetical protein
MKERIIKNEERLDSVLSSIKKLEDALNEFKSNKKNIDLLNKYYGSKNWFKDKEAFEKNEISNIKAGVLSEDAVWNMNEDITDLMKEMTKIVEN